MAEVDLTMDSDSETELARESIISRFTAKADNLVATSPPRERFQEMIAVELPKLDGVEEYETMPELPSESEVDSEPRRRDSASTEAHQTRRLRRNRKTRERNGFIDFTSVDFLSDDDGLERSIRRSTRQTAARSERDYQIVNDIDSSSASDSSLVRRSRRLISQIDLISQEASSDSSQMPQTRKRKRGLGRPSRQRSIQTKPERKGTRASQRQRPTAVGSMAERLEDDISEVEPPSAGPRYSAVKENFAKLSRDDPFRLRHFTVCDTCYSHGDSNNKGPLIFCQGCTASYHKDCLGTRSARQHLVTKVNAGNFIFQCRRCIGIARDKDPHAPHQGYCSYCNEPGPLSRPLRKRLTTRQEHLRREENGGTDPMTEVDPSAIDSVDNVMFRCPTCERAWHMGHLPPKLPRPSNTVEDSDDEDGDLRFREYSRRWECNECANMPGEVESLIAWRPVNLDTYVPGYHPDMMEESAKEYLVKWRKLSYFKASWMPGAWVWGMTQASMRNAFQNSEKNLKPMMTSEDAIPEEFLHVEIILDLRFTNVVSNRTKDIDMARAKEVDKVYTKYKGLQYEDVVWEKPPSPQDNERWQSFRKAYEDWVIGKYMDVPKSGPLKKYLGWLRTQNFESRLAKQRQPSILTGGQLKDFQQNGLNWIYYMWYQKRNAILADEMGLGKTIQVIAFFATLIQDHSCWPFLVVVPNSTCQNWRNEIKTWAPSLRVVMYYGSAVARKRAHDYEMFPEGGSSLRAHIVVTSYETMIESKAKLIFSRIPWQGLVVDEGQRLKSDKNQLYGALSNINFPFRLLLTGTPLQNNLRELFNILQFCDPSKKAEDLEREYQDLSKENVARLHDMIRPFLLRRTKIGSLNLPPVAQVIIPVTMNVVQKRLYKSILAKNTQLIKAIFKTNEKSSKPQRQNLNNILMQLRKVLSHPFVYSQEIEDRDVTANLLHRNLVEASSKLQLLELLLPKLHERGHRVLIFSQFLDFLTIIEDFLDGLGLRHLRLDGSMSSLEKQKHIDEYNNPNSPYFAFLLSTRAGGVGINLASADTVIIMDPDFNPQQDIQAVSRVHRIGQQKKVLVFQLMTRQSAEEKIMQIGKKKMVLDHVLIERLDHEEDAGEDVEAILRHGAQALFDEDDSGDINYDAPSVEKLLDRSHMENTRTDNDASAESQFSFARVWVNDNDTMEDGLGESESATPNWEKMLEERENAAAAEARAKAETLGRGKRRRTAIDYALPQSPAQAVRGRRTESDEEFQSIESDLGTSDIDFQDEQSVNGSSVNNSARARPYKRATIPPFDGVDHDASGDDSRRQRCPACDEFHKKGHCRLKLAGVEHCGLCGIAHFGYSRTCPHFHSEFQVAEMLGSLKQSTEQRSLVEEATKYLRGIRGDLVRRKKAKANKQKAKGSASTAGNSGHSGAPPTAAPERRAPENGASPNPGPHQQPYLQPPTGQYYPTH